MENQTIDLKLSIPHVNAILQALSQVPYSVAAPNIDTIRQQATPQVVQNTRVYEETEIKDDASE